MSAVGCAGWALALVAAGCACALRTRLAGSLALAAEAGHELRGPLCAARLALHALAREDPEVAHRVAAVDLELRRAGLALDDLAGGRAERRELVEVGALVERAQETWRPLAGAHRAELRVEPVPAGAYVRADPARLAQACGNLVANAAEHGASPVRVRVRVHGERVRIEVDDGGRGLPEPVADLVAAARGNRARRGHGLAVAAGIAERLGGRLSAAPSAEGAQLVLELPVAHDAAARELLRS